MVTVDLQRGQILKVGIFQQLGRRAPMCSGTARVEKVPLSRSDPNHVSIWRGGCDMRPVTWRFRVAALVLAAMAATSILAARQAPYYPPRGDWAKQPAASLGFDKAKLDEAIAFAIANQSKTDRDLAIATPEAFKSEAP